MGNSNTKKKICYVSKNQTGHLFLLFVCSVLLNLVSLVLLGEEFCELSS